VGRDAFVEVVARGGYPAVRTLGERQRRHWYRDYVQGIVERDLRDIASAQKLSEMPKLIRLLAAHSAKVLDYRGLASDRQISDKTVTAYIELLRTIFLVHVVPVCRPGLRTRELHAPKLFLTDTGLLAVCDRLRQPLIQELPRRSRRSRDGCAQPRPEDAHMIMALYTLLSPIRVYSGIRTDGSSSVGPCPRLLPPRRHFVW
jgi:predicted AAA+ superfamily ATPase